MHAKDICMIIFICNVYATFFCCLQSHFTLLLVLNKYIENLDKRLSVLTTTDLPGNVARKVRKPGYPSTTTPPLDAPAWAVRKESDSTTGGMLNNYHCLLISLLFH